MLEHRKKVHFASWPTRVLAPLAVYAPDLAKPKAKPIPTDIPCDECGDTMVIRTRRSGPFLGCSTHPKCKYSKPLGEGTMAGMLAACVS